MKYSSLQFKKSLKEQKLVISFIGMSNIGKTHWSKKLKGIGFEHINCDDLIEQKLEPVLKKYNYSRIEGVAKWMGQPYEPKSLYRQKRYLFYERGVMQKILKRIGIGRGGNMVVDTTGSIVHLDSLILKKLKQKSLIVYLKAGENLKQKMFRKYLEKPKPVVFTNLYTQKRSETRQKSLERCYGRLLSRRETLYEYHADIVIPYAKLNTSMSSEKFLSLITKNL
jgi:shikimate kinase